MPVILKPTSVIKIELGIQPDGPVQRFATHSCREHMEKYVPKKTGRLRHDVIETSNSIIYKSQGDNGYYYPERLYKHQFNHYTTPGTGPYWDERMWTVEGQDVIDEIQDYIRRK